MNQIYKANSFQMRWCMECHFNPEQYLRPREEVYTFGYQPPIPQAMQPQMTTPAPVQPRVLTARTDGLVPRLTQDELSQQVISLSDVRARALASAQQQLRGAAGAKFVSRDGTEANRALAATQLEMTPDGRVAHGMNRTS
jgi:hypothetical protein